MLEIFYPKGYNYYKFKLLSSIKLDEEDFALFNLYYWVTTKDGYLRRDDNKKAIFFHKEILGTDLMVDHINRNTSDNRKCNLRITNYTLNRANAKKTIGFTSKYKGVFKRKRKLLDGRTSESWISVIYISNKRVYLGVFYIEEDAARAYDKAAKEIFGEFALLNFPS